MAVGQTGVAGALAECRRRIAAAAERSGRDPAGITLVAVTKTVEPARILEAVEAGVREVGENRVREALAKQAELPDGLRWHLLGHLQTNKAARAAAAFDVVHSVDAERVAAALESRRPPDRPPLAVLLEVELTGLPGHTGYAPDDVAGAAKSVAAKGRLRLIGLMAMAPPGSAPEAARPAFRRLRRLRDEVQERTGLALPELSMGMTGDFEVAVEEGATMVRLGRAVFGERPLAG